MDCIPAIHVKYQKFWSLHLSSEHSSRFQNVLHVILKQIWVIICLLLGGYLKIFPTVFIFLNVVNQTYTKLQFIKKPVLTKINLKTFKEGRMFIIKYL